MSGIIYKIVCNETNKVYYGSTTQSLNKRMACHKSGCKRWKEGTFCYLTSFQIIERGNYSYSLIETVVCKDRILLEQRERYYIENNECVNKIIVGRTQKEYDDVHNNRRKAYRETNKEHIKAQKKEHYEANKNEIKENRKQYYEANKKQISKQKKAYDQANREQRKAWEIANRERRNEQQRQRYLKQKQLKELLNQ